MQWAEKRESVYTNLLERVIPLGIHSSVFLKHLYMRRVKNVVEFVKNFWKLFSNPVYIPITINISIPPLIDNWIQTFNRLRHCRIGFIHTFLSYISRQNVYTKSYNKNKDISKNNDSTLKKKFSCNLQLRTWYKTASSLKAHFDYQ